MLGSSMLDTAIGVIFFYLFLSLIVTALNEMTATLLALRAKNLEEGIRNLLRDETARQHIGGVAAPFWWIVDHVSGNCIAESDPIPKSIEQVDAQQQRDLDGSSDDTEPETDGLASRLYRHGLIDGLSKENSLPSYIPPNTFAQVLYDLLIQDAYPVVQELAKRPPADLSFPEIAKVLGEIQDPRLREALLAVLSRAEIEYDKEKSMVAHFVGEVASWYDNTMDRVSGWYKRKTLAITILYAVVLVIAVNGDSIRMVQTVYHDSNLRSALVTAAANTTAPGKTAADTKYTDVEKNIEAAHLSIPLGYSEKFASNFGAYGWAFWRWHYTVLETLVKIVGLTATVMAISLGAPFWFDTLRKVTNLRGSGNAPSDKPSGS